MPVYCFRCSNCGRKYQITCNYSSLKKDCLNCGACGRPLDRDFQAEGMNFQLKGQCWSADDYNRTEGDRQKSYVQQKKMLPEHLDNGYPRDEDYKPKTLYFHGK